MPVIQRPLVAIRPATQRMQGSKLDGVVEIM